MSFDNNKYIQDIISSSMNVKQDLLNSNVCIQMINKLAKLCLDALKKDGKIIFAGNGGSFGDSQHISAEFTSRFLFDRKPLASVALGTNSSSMSAIGNDYGYDFVFSRELEALGRPMDVFVPITTSGNSLNIVEAIKIANEKGIRTIGLTGSNNGKIIEMCECISVPSKDTGRIQECHILIGHIVCGLVEKSYFKK